MTTPEAKARKAIDKKLVEAGWVIQDMNDFNPSASLGVAVREFQTDTGPADYMLFVDMEPVGVVEAKRDEEGARLLTVEEQSARYATSKLKGSNSDKPLSFAYESTSEIIRFTDYRDPAPRSREVFYFHRPESFQEMLKEGSTLRARMQQFPELSKEGLRDCQFRAINNLEQSFSENRPKALIQMATGAGKTFTAITSTYRLLKYAKAKRILFLVDTRNLGKQAEQEFQAYTPIDDKRKFTELYSVQRLQSSFVDPHSQVCISTIQRMYSILRGEELDESAEETSLNEVKQTGKPKEVAYNPKVPIESFNVIIIDECHRSIYNLWKQVLDYFDAFLVGLTATPDSRTFAFFNENVVSEYTHEQAVADNVNVGYDVYTIETEITKQGEVIKAKELIETRNRLTRRKEWMQPDEDVEYTAKDLDKKVVNPSQIRTIVKKYKEILFKELYPEREEVPKTLIFAKTDSHADDIIKIVREEFGEGNKFCKKVTYRNDEESPDEVLQQFRTAYYPRVAVTVDMIATGTDVKAIECLIFMRDVKSRNYFEQMKGRGTRTYKKDDLKKVTPSAKYDKDHFVIVDAVGVCKSVKTDSRPLERKRSVKTKDLMLSVVMGTRDEDTLTSLANRITRLDKKISAEERNEFKNVANNKTPTRVVSELLDAYSPDRQIEKAKEIHAIAPDEEPTDEQINEAKEVLVKDACMVFFKPELRHYIEDVTRNYEQLIDDTNIDKVVSAGYDKDAKERARQTIQSFKQFIEENKDEITALRIFYSQPYRRKELTFKMIKELNEALQKPPYHLSTEKIWHAYNQLHENEVKGASAKKMLTDIVALLRYESGMDEELTPLLETVNQNFKDWVFKKNAGPKQFTEEQMEWLRMIKDHIAASIHMERDDLDNTPFAERGGLGKAWELFGEDMDEIVGELNEILAA